MITLGFANAAIYKNAQEGSSFEAPAGWTQSEYTGALVVFLAQQNVGAFRPNLNVVVQNVPPEMTLKQ